MNKFILQAISVLLLGVFFLSFNVAAQDVSVFVEGQPLYFYDNYPVIIDGRTFIPLDEFESLDVDVYLWEEEILTIDDTDMLPLRVVAEYAGYFVDWDDDTRTVLIAHPFEHFIWPVASMEISLWYGRLDRLSYVNVPGLNIQCEANPAVHAISDGIVSDIGDRVFVDFLFNGREYRVVYGNITPYRFSVGDHVQRGDMLGQMREHMGRYVLELIIYTKCVNGYFETTDPAPFFDLSRMPTCHLWRPMSNFFIRYAEEQGIVPTDADIGFAHNEGLYEDEMYLIEWARLMFQLYNKAEDGIRFEDMFIENDDGTTLVIIDGEYQLFIPMDMCEDEALYNHRRRMEERNLSP